VEPIKELNPGRWVIFSTYQGNCWRVHLVILTSVELKGYPAHLSSVQPVTWLTATKPCQGLNPRMYKVGGLGKKRIANAVSV